MSNKQKGSNIERELYKMLIEACYKAARVAGSGTAGETSADLIAGKGRRKFCIEVKSSKKTEKYISKKQIEEFIIFSTIFGLNPIIAIRFNREGWFFLNPKYLEDCGKNWKVSLSVCRKKGKRFGQMFG